MAHSQYTVDPPLRFYSRNPRRRIRLMWHQPKRDYLTVKCQITLHCIFDIANYVVVQCIMSFLFGRTKLISGHSRRRMSVIASVLRYHEFGDPAKVLQLQQETISDPTGDEVLIKTLCAPINPADINTIQGKYPVKPQFPAVGGNECVGEVAAVGSQVNGLKVGDRVVPFATGLGTWRSHAVCKAANLMKVPPNIGIAEAATITVNPCTGYRMLKDFVSLKPGDTVIQNGANSACGQAIIQLCRDWNVRCVGIVRDRPDFSKLRDYLKNLGAAEILTEEELRSTKIFKDGIFKKPKLALNCVGGKNALEMSRNLDNHGIMVTYGGMSREPVTVPTASLIFKDLRFVGFWMTRWTKENATSPERESMFTELFGLIDRGTLKAPAHEMIAFKDYVTGVTNALNIQGFVGKKYLLKF
ncbi:enoyl-[acyl-carrier-protein] reductase, mitochondrial [Toxorhynchites rutilus septentrionalis]|uniref:enoyl-[acyl-carrier-protein] reductase, mitochondrial n=1 Tax=Toxorhynchites rutilus septentrionalis TaxID=329112 RepID=UPI00247A28DD|nr:enoyl-[acyl-carrier-protein] reductase, mitochondrial [Toxorhynchites rutilus septentrionalis]